MGRVGLAELKGLLTAEVMQRRNDVTTKRRNVKTTHRCFMSEDFSSQTQIWLAGKLHSLVCRAYYFGCAGLEHPAFKAKG